MSNDLYPIINGAVTLYVRAPIRDAHFSFCGFTVEGDENLYTPTELYINVANRPNVVLREHLFAVYETRAKEQLAAYLEQHIADELLAMDFEGFWSEAGMQPLIRYDRSICLDRVIDGIVGIRINDCSCHHSFVTKSPVEYKQSFGKASTDMTPMKVFFGGRVNQLLALEQYRIGLAPPVYTELARLNAFLKGKKSVKLVMKDGTTHEYKYYRGSELMLRWLMSYHPGSTMPFWLDDSYDLKPRFGRKRPLSDLEYFQHGKQRFVIDMDALSKFEREEATSL